MSEKIVVRVNRNAAEMDLTSAAAEQEKLRKKFQSQSNWPIITKGPVGALFFGMYTYPKVFFDHFVMESPLYSLSIFQETILRSMKYSLNSPLKTLRRSGSFVETIIRIFRCTEKFRLLDKKTKTELGVDGYWLGPVKYKHEESEATILYLHGGGYVALSSLIGIRSLCYILRNLRKRYNKHVRVIAIDYTLAPEDPFPTGLNCAERTYKWLVKSGIAGTKNIFLCGDSAGAGLSLALLQRLYQKTNINIPLPLGVILISPWVELSCDSLSYFTNAKFDWLETHSCQFAAECYVFGKEGNPARKRSKMSQQSKDMIMDWLEKVEDNIDFIEFEESYFKRLSDASKRLSGVSRRLSLNSNKRYSVKGKRVSGGAIPQKRRSHVRESITEEITEEFKNFTQENFENNIIESNKIDENNENPYRNPLISPLHIPHHILARFPPLFISYGGKELFRDDIEMFTKKCIESKKAFAPSSSDSEDNENNENTTDESLDNEHPDVVVEMDEHMVHDYPIFIDVFGKRSRKALDRVISFIGNRMPLSNDTVNTFPNSRKLPRDSI